MTRILLIKTAEAEKIKSVLDREHIDYQVIVEAEETNPDQHLTEAEIWKRDAYLASQDKEREKELKEWDKITSKIDDE